MKIEKIVTQLNEKDFNLIREQFIQTKADKYLTLLDFYRKDSSQSEKDIQNEMDVKSAAFYTLKSRLYDKIQEFLYKSTTDTRIELLQNVANIEFLLYRAPKEIAIGLLQKMEAELIKNDMPNELITVYKALKKLHVYSAKFYDYQQLYNKFVAYNLAQDKVEELLSSFCKTLSLYYVTRDPKLLDILSLYKKETLNICRIHQSHRLTVYKNILNIQYALFCPVAEEMKNDSTIEDMLKETYSILETNTEDSSYSNLINALNYLSFEYYHHLKLYKNAGAFYEKIADDNCSILLYNHTCFSVHFLISRLEWNYANNTLDNLNENEELIYVPEQEDTTEYIVYNLNKAGLLFYKNKIQEASQTLNKLINDVSFKDILHSEIEAKLFLILLLLLAEKQDQAEIILRSISRKIADEDNEIKYFAALLYIKLFKTVLTGKATGKLEKLKEIHQLLKATNTGQNMVLSFVNISDEQLIRLSKL
jgi:ACT domain-containing protein